MESVISTFTYPNNEIQRVQKVTLDSWDSLNIFKPVYNKESFDRLCDLYRSFIIKKFALVFGKIIIYTLPENIEVPFSFESETYGHIYDKFTAVSIAFKEGIRCKNGKLQFKNQLVHDFFRKLEKEGYLYVAEGKRNTVSILPVGYSLGFMSESKTLAKLKVNSSFFVMDKLDCATVYDLVGTPIGLQIKEGKVYNPSLFDRETLFVDMNNNVCIRQSKLEDLSVIVDGHIYTHNVNCQLLSRPTTIKSTIGGTDIIIVNNKVVALKNGGNCEVPSGGFVIHLTENIEMVNCKEVSYKDVEGIKFAMQVGNSVCIDGVKTEKFISKFYNFLQFYKPSYPPSMYPLNYQKNRAPRIVLGSDKENNPVILWFEGAGKFGYEVGKESCGASLSEVADISEKLGLVNGINLDGGGSAQILLNGNRELLVSDREPESFAEKERAISLGLYVD